MTTALARRAIGSKLRASVSPPLQTLQRARERLSGHLWTLVPHLKGRLFGRSGELGRPFAAEVPDERYGSVQVTGRLLEQPPGAEHGRSLYVVLHGLGGSIDSVYMQRAAQAALAAGADVLLVNQRGAGGSGEDVYHAGLGSDLHAVVANEALSGYQSLFILGHSLGGHIALSAATGPVDPRVRAVAAVCSPLCLSTSATAIDLPGRWLYRQHILTALKQSYAAVARRRGLDPHAARGVRTLRGWDERVIAPRFGFASAEDYYAKQSVAPRLADLRVPALYVGARCDPIVPESTVAAALAPQHPKLTVRWLARGGHVGFPATASLGSSGALGLEAQVVSWLGAQG